jgi:hypothetical protein
LLGNGELTDIGQGEIGSSGNPQRHTCDNGNKNANAFHNAFV